MNPHINLEHPADLKIVNSWLAESKIRMTRNILLGTAAIVLAGGIGATGIVWAIGQMGPNAEQRAADLKAALADLQPLKIEPVKLADGSEVSMKDGRVVLEQPAKVQLDPNATVKLDGSSLPVQKPDLPSLPQKGTDVIKQEVVVFSTVEEPAYDRAVITGWKFYSGAAGQKPFNQFCYLTWNLADGTMRRVDIAENGKPTSRARALVQGFDAAVAKCVWF